MIRTGSPTLAWYARWQGYVLRSISSRFEVEAIPIAGPGGMSHCAGPTVNQ